jgi:hypothetical protein
MYQVYLSNGIFISLCSGLFLRFLTQFLFSQQIETIFTETITFSSTTINLESFIISNIFSPLVCISKNTSPLTVKSLFFTLV